MIQSTTGPQGKLGALPVSGNGRLRVTCHAPAPSAWGQIKKKSTPQASVCSLSSTSPLGNLQELRDPWFPVGDAEMFPVFLVSSRREEQGEGKQRFSHLNECAKGQRTLLRQLLIQCD